MSTERMKFISSRSSSQQATQAETAPELPREEHATPDRASERAKPQREAATAQKGAAAPVFIPVVQALPQEDTTESVGR